MTIEYILSDVLQMSLNLLGVLWVTRISLVGKKKNFISYLSTEDNIMNNKNFTSGDHKLQKTANILSWYLVAIYWRQHDV